MRIFTTTACLLLITLWSCSNFDAAPDPHRGSFIHIYEGPNSFAATDLLIEDDGYLILGNMLLPNDTIVTFLIKTDLAGNEKEIKLIEEVVGTGKTIKKFSNNNFTGYLIFGDYAKINPNAAQVGNIVISSARLIGLNQDLEFQGSLVIGDTIPETIDRPVLTDFTGSAMTLADDGRVVLITSYKPAGLTERPWVVVLDKDFQFDSSDPYKQVDDAYVDWADPYLSIDKDYIMGKSVHYNNKHIIWASSILKQTGNFNDSYIAIPYLEEPLSPSNADAMDFSSLKLFKAIDIQPAKAPNSSAAYGYGIVGTFGDVDNTHKNMFFTTVKANGTIDRTDTIFIDSYRKQTSSGSSQIEDTGEALTATSDGGFVIAGTMLTASVNGKEFGNGERDILLAKIDAFGDVLWIKTLGGSGDEVVSSIRETRDRGLLISGTNNVGGYSSIFLIKTDKNGELKK